MDDLQQWFNSDTAVTKSKQRLKYSALVAGTVQADTPTQQIMVSPKICLFPLFSA